MYINLNRKERKLPSPDSTHKCPFCDKDYKPRDPWRESQCVLNKPLMMVIPPGGIHLSCPIHADGHHVFDPEVYYMERREPGYSRKWDNNLPDPEDKITCDMTYRPDQDKFRM